MKAGNYFLATLCAIAFCLSCQVWGQDVPAATQPSDDNPQAKRLTFLGDQLSADEAAIKEIDHRLVVAGYQQAQAAEKADNYAKGNELMDRNGGAPIHWQDFYGRTARDFIVRDTYDAEVTGGPVLHAQVHAESGAYQLQRPTQFDYVYRANDQQIAAARAEIASMGDQVDKLLARRRELEAEQSSLWATIAFESIGNRDISLRPLYRDQLKANPAKANDNRPDPARVEALRSATLYLKTLDHAVSAEADKLDADQGSAYLSLRETMQQAEDSLREASAAFADTPGVDDGEARQVADVVSQARGLQDTCKDICDAFRKAADADAAGEEGRKLLYRGTLQNALFTFAEAAVQLDDTLTKVSEAWDIRPEQGVRSADQPGAVLDVPAPQMPTVAVAPSVAQNPSPAPIVEPAPSQQPAAQPAGPAESAALHRPGEIWTNSIGMKFAYIPAGEFEMGSPETETGRFRSETQHHVTLTRPFMMSVTLVTVSQFRDFVNDARYATTAEANGFAYIWKGNKHIAVQGFSWRNPGFDQQDECPVVDMTWDDACAYCNWLSKKEGRRYRLPTEAEFEYACRAGSTSAYYDGDSIEQLKEVAWISGNSQARAHPVAQKQPNAWGLYDILGNAAQWCSDWYGDYASTETTDPLGSPSGSLRVNRGGCFSVGWRLCRCAARGHIPPGEANFDTGFRVAMDLGAAVVDAAAAPIEAVATASSNLADRQIAERVLRLGGTLTLFIDGNEVQARSNSQFPNEPFTVVGVSFRGHREIGDSEVAFLSNFPSLKVLDLGATGITNATLRDVVGQLTGLRRLWIGRTQISDLQSISGLPNLDDLSLSATPISDQSLQAIRGMTNLTTLWLGGCRVSDRGMSAISGLTNLTFLNLAGTQVTDQGLRALAGMTRLTRLKIGDTSITDTAVYQVLPNCQIQR